MCVVSAKQKIVYKKGLEMNKLGKLKKLRKLLTYSAIVGLFVSSIYIGEIYHNLVMFFGVVWTSGAYIFYKLLHYDG